MAHRLSYETAIAMLRTIQLYTPSDFDVLGITQEQFEKVSGPTPWRREEMNLVIRTMNAILFGSLEIMAVPKITVPSEFIAAHIVALIHPGNRMVACIWMAQERQTGVGAMDLAARQDGASVYDPTSADQLFALVCQLSDSSYANTAREQFRERLGLKIEAAEEGLQL